VNIKTTFAIASVCSLNNQTYSYDDEDRLASFNRNNGDNQTWNLSLVGDWNQFNNNGVMENRTHNAVHELTAVNAVPLAYDVKGNLTGNSNGQTYAWDIENRLTTATQGANTLGTYAYDALGRRVSKTVGANTTVFVSDGMQKICEYENGTLARSYAYGSYIDEPLVMISGVNKYYYHSNNLYSVAALTDAAGAVIERYKYDPYGKATILAADGLATRTASIVNNPFLYDGYYHDTETGLEFVNARYYSSDLGRFIARDPIGYEGSKWNLYEYVKSAPNFQIDPMGLIPGKPFIDKPLPPPGLGEWVYDPQPPRLINGQSASYDMYINIYMPPFWDTIEPGKNPQGIIELQAWQLNNRDGYYIKKGANEPCALVPVHDRIIDIVTLDHTSIRKDASNNFYIRDQSVWIMNDPDICFAYIVVTKLIGFNAKNQVLREGMFENPTDAFWTNISNNMRGPKMSYSQTYFYSNPKCNCCFPNLPTVLVNTGIEFIDAGGKITRSN
jgi:RHS repeat-associated protein